MNVRTTISRCLALAVLLAPAPALAQGARLQLDQLTRLAEKSEETVDVSVDTAMLKQAAGFLAGKGADADQLNSMINDIRGIYVKSFKFSTPNAYSDSDVESVRKQVSGSAWARVVSVREKQQLTEIYIFREKETNGGLVVLTAQPEEFTVVNIVGEINLASLAALGPMIPKLPEAIRKTVPK